MKLYRVILPVDDIEVAANYYSGIFNLEGMRVSPGRHYFNLGGTILACYDPRADGDPPHPTPVFHPNQYLYFATGDLGAIHQKVKQADGKRVDDSIETMPWGERLFYANDPFGNPICFVDENTMFTGD